MYVFEKFPKFLGRDLKDFLGFDRQGITSFGPAGRWSPIIEFENIRKKFSGYLLKIEKVPTSCIATLLKFFRKVKTLMI